METSIVLVTGISGFIAKHVAFALLQAGYPVRGTVRSLEKADAVRAGLEAAGADVSRLECVEADLGSDAGWQEAVAGCRYVQHLASPFPLQQPEGREDLVPTARGGALRVLNLARDAGVERLVLTSSVAAMMYPAEIPADFTFSEDDWTDPDRSTLTPYVLSKMRAEHAAWAWAADNGWKDRLVVVNPGLVLGPAMDGRIGTSLDVVKMFMAGAYPAVPEVYFPVVDVRDIAALHLKGMTSAAAGGRRLLGTADTMSMLQICLILREAFPGYAKKIPSRQLPAFLVKLLSVFDKSVRAVVPDLGIKRKGDAAYVTGLTGVTFRPAKEAVVAAGESLVKYGLV